MELLEQLEQRIFALLDRVDALAAENATLKQAQAEELSSLAEENHSLRLELEQERSINQSASARLTDILHRIRERTEHE